MNLNFEWQKIARWTMDYGRCW